MREIGADRAAHRMIRRARTDDLDAILRIEQASFPDPWGPETFRGMMRRDDAQVLVLHDSVGLIGYAIFWWVAGEAELGNIAIDPERRSGGHGRWLLGEVLSRMIHLRIECCYLEVREANQPARRLYEAAGFVVVGRRRNYYRHPVEDALVMRIDLSHGCGILEETAEGGLD